MIAPLEIAEAHEPLSVPGGMSSPFNIPPSGACGWCGALFGKGYCLADPLRLAVPACGKEGQMLRPVVDPEMTEWQMIVNWLGDVARGDGPVEVRIAALQHLADIVRGMHT